MTADKAKHCEGIFGVVERVARAHSKAYVTAAARDDSRKSVREATPQKDKKWTKSKSAF